MSVDVVRMRARPAGFSVALAVTVVLFHLACPIVIASQGSRFATTAFTQSSDIARYRAIARSEGTAYKDFEVEYPPLAYGVFRASGGNSLEDFRLRLLALQVVSQAVIVFLLFRVWSSRAAWWYLLLSAPMLFVVYSGFDLLSVALSVCAMALIRIRRPVDGAIALVVATFTKIWPVVLLPVLIVRRQSRALLAGLLTGGVGLAAWSAWAGTDGIGQVLTYRGARGWEYESLPASMLRLVTRGALHFEAGSWRVGAPPRAISLLLSAALVAAVAGIWWLTARREHLPDGLAETAVITALLVFATLLSPQFLLWPLPFAAIAIAAGVYRLLFWAGAVSGLTLLVRVAFDPAHPDRGWSELLILGRNAALVGMLVVAVIELRTPSPARMG